VGLGGVGVGELEVGLDHFHGGVTEEHLQGVGVAAVAQVVDGKGVAEAARVGVRKAGAVAEGATPSISADVALVHKRRVRHLPRCFSDSRAPPRKKDRGKRA
jgi:hypothetical protein